MGNRGAPLHSRSYVRGFGKSHPYATFAHNVRGSSAVAIVVCSSGAAYASAALLAEKRSAMSAIAAMAHGRTRVLMACRVSTCGGTDPIQRLLSGGADGDAAISMPSSHSRFGVHRGGEGP